ncbi:MAG: hypothetical protein AAF085_02525 [Planctomycetota bacterium]
MAKFLTVLNVVAGFASIVGLYIALDKKAENIDGVVIAIFVVTVLIALYVLLIPNNPLQKNVEAKLSIYECPNKGKIMIQTGNSQIIGGGPVTVEFDPPFADAPDVVPINAGNESMRLPDVENITYSSAMFTRGAYRGTKQESFKWIATGKPIDS